MGESRKRYGKGLKIKEEKAKGMRKYGKVGKGSQKVWNMYGKGGKRYGKGRERYGKYRKR